MKYCIFCLLMVTFCLAGVCQEGTNEWLKMLNETIGQTEKYDGEKISRIEQIIQKYQEGKNGDLFDLYEKLYTEYASFNWDSSYSYAIKMQQASLALNDSSLMAYSALKINTVLLSSGMFKEVFDSLTSIDIYKFSNPQKAEYYILKARSLYDLADYNHDKVYAPLYNKKANSFIDSALIFFPVNSFEHAYYSGLKFIRAGDDLNAAVYFKDLIRKPSLSAHEVALTASTYADIYLRTGPIDSAINLLIRAAIGDIQSSTKETSAIFNLATLLFKQGDLNNSSTFIQKAAGDAQFYGARQRMIQLSTILPLIEAEKLSVVENEKRSIYTYAVVVTSLFVLLIALILIIRKQVRKLKTQQKVINHKNLSQQKLLHEKDILLEEKEWLLKEVHHRVKNNLHTVMSLLETQSAFLQDEALLALKDSQHRVYAMSLIHQKLYQSGNVKNIDMSVYLPELVNYLKDSFDTRQRIRFDLQIEPVELDVSQAVPLALILNEAITNSIKYAFPLQNRGVIMVSITQPSKDHFLLTVADDGIGLPAGFDIAKSSSLGMRLMKGLSEDIQAGFCIGNNNGAVISISFYHANILNPEEKSNGPVLMEQ